MRIFSVFLVSLPGLIGLFLILRAFFDANTSDLRYAFAVMGMFGLALCIPLPTKPLTRNFWLFAIVCLVTPVLLIFPMTVVVLIFGKVDAAAFVFHLIFGIKGTPWHDIIPYIVTALIFWVTVVGTTLRLLPLFPMRSTVLLASAGGLLAINPIVNDILWHRANAAFGPVRTLLSDFRPPKLVDAPASPDLVILYLEGFDRGYMDTERFGEIAAPLRDLEKEGISFINLHQIEATGWSLAGNIATQCGAPLLPFGARPLGDTSSIARIMPDLTCLTDILVGRRYDVTYMSGAKIIGNQMGYYGFDNFFRTHGDITILDRDTISNPRTEELKAQAMDAWGLADSELLDAAKTLFDAKAKENRPFAVFIATMDTHGPVAAISPACTESGEPIAHQDMRLAVECVSRISAEFVRSLFRDAKGRDLRVAVFSDHLNHASNLIGILEQKPRFNTAMLLGGEFDPAVIDRPGSMVDLYPTILDWLGLLDRSIPYAGLGTSLLSGKPTIIETRGLDDVNATLKVDVRLASFLWQDRAATGE